MDVTSKESIQKVKKEIEKEDGKLHVLVNKYVSSSRPLI
jgi:enoyl-[acyl-carrier-protein] reductase (NADH)